MAKSSQIQKGMSLSMFQRICGTEEKCAEELEELRRSGGFECPSCKRA